MSFIELLLSVTTLLTPITDPQSALIPFCQYVRHLQAHVITYYRWPLAAECPLANNSAASFDCFK